MQGTTAAPDAHLANHKTVAAMAAFLHRLITKLAKQRRFCSNSHLQSNCPICSTILLWHALLEGATNTSQA
jgi:hypothetical protein